MDVNQAGIDLIKRFEGCKLVVYKDAGGLSTVGFGHMDRSMVVGTHITQAEADDLLAKDLARIADAVTGMLEVEPTENEFAALVAFAFNVGPHNLETSHLLGCFNDGDDAGAAAQFGRWDKVGGVVYQGLVNRRAAEVALFNSA